MAAIPKDWVDAYFERGIDKQNRRIFLDGEISTESAAVVRKGLLYLESQSKTEPIDLWIASEGGCEYGMFSVYDTLQSVSCPVMTLATGLCMSAAPLLVAAGSHGYRYATPNTFFMVHSSWDEFGVNRIDELKRTLSHYEAMGKKWANLMAKNTNLTAKQWLAMCSKVGDHYFDAEKAIEYGIIDGLWSGDKKD